MQRDPILRSMYEEYLDSQKELALTYASYEETLDKKFAEIENSFFHPYCGFEERRAGRAEVTRHNIIIHAAERYVRPTVQEKQFRTHLRKSQPRPWLRWEMLLRSLWLVNQQTRQQYRKNSFAQ